MKEWTYTQDSFLIAGITEDGLPFFEKKLQGWNDNEDFSDREDLVIVNAVIYDDGTEILLKNIYSSEEAYSNPTISKKGEEIEQVLLEEVHLWLNGAN
jgi:hypothetical protein